MKQKIAQICLIIIFAFAGTYSVMAEGVAHLLSGIPIYEGFVEDEDRGVIFDKPDGRIIEALFHGSGRLSAIGPFYRESMPAIGWQFVEGDDHNMIFERNDEHLQISFEGEEEIRSIAVFIRPIQED